VRAVLAPSEASPLCIADDARQLLIVVSEGAHQRRTFCGPKPKRPFMVLSKPPLPMLYGPVVLVRLRMISRSLRVRTLEVFFSEPNVA